MKINKLLKKFFIILIITLSFPFTAISHAETTSIHLNVNKSNRMHRHTKHGNIPIGMDKLCISYDAQQHAPTGMTQKNSILGDNKKLLTGLLCNNSTSCNNNIENSKNIYYFDLGLGRTMNYAEGNEAYLKKLPTIRATDKFTVGNMGKGVLLLISGGYVWQFDSRLAPYASLGLEYSYMPSVTLHGNIYNTNSDYPAFKYQYRINHTNLRLVGKVNLYRWKSFMPYAAVGLGGSWNFMGNYKEHLQALPRSESTTFKGMKKFDFSYGAAVGIDYIYKPSFLLSLGYRYDNFGSNKTGNAMGHYKGNHLSNSLYSNTVMLTGRYLFE